MKLSGKSLRASLKSSLWRKEGHNSIELISQEERSSRKANAHS
ncbi:hypothetical protein PVAP13_8NG318852 [Panicum virgatum]|uniref:Uncharacterized protein n=1 Tax=Panicum virgatum TaxID=38727 RepID=A0A8T0PDX8_PANVG|nr:hypothetical protein PVAP13_8NG318852 [Panicum virgatum]